ncbi:MAG: 50S ribosomal protein L11 methyltransferase [Alphaproteobacteria bacterium]|nr:50S ribosomal protein L11 methyltransferase [Alphaproteobacteria bacterium]
MNETQRLFEKLLGDFIALKPVAFCPPIQLYTSQVAAETLWQQIQDILKSNDFPIPFWAYPWVGGQGLARYILDHPEIVRGKKIVDFASGSGLVAIAAALAGAKKVYACDIDPFARLAILRNAKANNVKIKLKTLSFHGGVPWGTACVLGGDIFYEHRMAYGALAWLRKLAGKGIEVFLGDPGRAYMPHENIEELAIMNVPTPYRLEDKDSREVMVFKLIR